LAKSFNNISLKEKKRVYLPDYKNDKQRKIYINNLIQEMARTTIVNVGTRIKSKWILKENIK